MEHPTRTRFWSDDLRALLAAALTLAAGGAQSQTIELAASGLDNPRGLAVGKNGAVYVAESGQGGTGTCVVTSEPLEVCFGATGAITRISGGGQQRVVSGLPSLAAPDGSGGVGPHDLALRNNRRAYVVMGLTGPPDLRDELGSDGTDFGRLLEVDLHSGSWEAVGDLVAHEAAHNPDGGVLDTNPYGIFARANQWIVADAGGNDLLRVRRGGSVETLAVFPLRLADAPEFLGLPPGEQIPMEAVPTTVVQGPDGAYYVGQLTGFPFPKNQARVYRLEPGGELEVYAGGFTNIIDIGFGPDGLLYVLEIATRGLLSDGPPTGSLMRIAADGSREVVAKRGLFLPGGFAFGTDGSIYVSNCSACPAGAGEVLRIEP